MSITKPPHRKGAHSFRVSVSDRLLGPSDDRRIVSAQRGSVSGRGFVSIGGRGGQFQSDSCRSGPKTDPGMRPKLTMS